MNNLAKLRYFIKQYLPMFFLLCFSGNPIIIYSKFSRILLIISTLLFFIYILFIIDVKLFKKAIKITVLLVFFISILIFFQRNILGFVSYPGVIATLLKIIFALTVLLHYQHEKIDFLDVYVKILAFLAIISIPFWIVNFFGFYGLKISDNSIIKTFILYTSYKSGNLLIRNSGMFWEPGAFSGYLILGIIFIALKNGKFKAGNYKRENFMILTGLLTTMSTTGFLILGLILITHVFQNYRLGTFIILPLLILIMGYAYISLDFLKEKIESQYSNALVQKEDEISNTRFGSLKMDLQYIKSQPLTGNGLHVKTRYRFHPQVQGDLGHGNGMSNFIVSWGIPLFLIWLFYLYRFAHKVSRSAFTAFAVLIIMVLLLQGEQFLNYPVFLSFFVLPFIYENKLSVREKIQLINKLTQYKIDRINKNNNLYASSKQAP